MSINPSDGYRGGVRNAYMLTEELAHNGHLQFTDSDDGWYVQHRSGERMHIMNELINDCIDDQNFQLVRNQIEDFRRACEMAHTRQDFGEFLQRMAGSTNTSQTMPDRSPVAQQVGMTETVGRVERLTPSPTSGRIERRPFADLFEPSEEEADDYLSNLMILLFRLLGRRLVINESEERAIVDLIKNRNTTKAEIDYVLQAILKGELNK